MYFRHMSSSRGSVVIIINTPPSPASGSHCCNVRTICSRHPPALSPHNRRPIRACAPTIAGTTAPSWTTPTASPCSRSAASSLPPSSASPSPCSPWRSRSCCRGGRREGGTRYIQRHHHYLKVSFSFQLSFLIIVVFFKKTLNNRHAPFSNLPQKYFLPQGSFQRPLAISGICCVQQHIHIRYHTWAAPYNTPTTGAKSYNPPPPPRATGTGPIGGRPRT